MGAIFKVGFESWPLTEHLAQRMCPRSKALVLKMALRRSFGNAAFSRELADL
jgi:hypothetical protein